MNARHIPILLLIVGAVVFVAVGAYFLTSQRTTVAPRAATSNQLELAGMVEKLEPCISTLLCYDLINQADGVRYHLYSKRYPSVTGGEAAGIEATINFA